MKKFAIFLYPLVITLLLNPISIYGKEKKAGIKAKAIQQVENSFNRLKHCFQGKCTKTEALKVARDLGIAAVAAVSALYITGTALKKGAELAPEALPGKDIAYKTGYYLQRPGRPFVRPLDRTIAKVTRPFYAFQFNDPVQYQGSPYRVLRYNPTTKTATLVGKKNELGLSPLLSDIPASELQLKK